ncbi:MAG: hypothetical protein ACRD40_02085 [Candidatus Acidiferrales bacterium]
MLQLLFFLGVGALLFLLLALLARRGKAEGGARALIGARQALYTLWSELLPQDLVARIFAREDLEFVLSLRSPAVQSTFFQQRKRVALLWVERVQGQIRHLRHLHLGSARFYARLEFKTELLLAWNFTVLLVSCSALKFAILVGGPYAAQVIVDMVAEAATRVCEISARSLAFLSGAGLEGLGGPTGSLPPF